MSQTHIVFFGAPEFAASVLKKILENDSERIGVRAVVTQPDKAAGRKQIMTATPVKQLALSHGIPVIESVNDARLVPILKETDVALLYAYHAIIPQSLLVLPKWGFWNIHPSLLPRYRGSSPIAYPLLMNDLFTGVSLAQMDSLLDHGPIIAQERYDIAQNDTSETLRIRLSDIGYKLFIKSVQDMNDGLLHKVEQLHESRTFTRMLSRQDGFLPYSVVSKIIRGENVAEGDLTPIFTQYMEKYGNSASFDIQHFPYYLFRATFPWPGVWTLIPLKDGEKRLKITGMTITDGEIAITKVQLEGKKEVDFPTFRKAYGL